MIAARMASRSAGVFIVAGGLRGQRPTRVVGDRFHTGVGIRGGQQTVEPRRSRTWSRCYWRPSRYNVQNKFESSPSLFSHATAEADLCALRPTIERDGPLGDVIFVAKATKVFERGVTKQTHGGDRKILDFMTHAASKTLTP